MRNRALSDDEFKHSADKKYGNQNILSASDMHSRTLYF